MRDARREEKAERREERKAEQDERREEKAEERTSGARRRRSERDQRREEKAEEREQRREEKAEERDERRADKEEQRDDAVRRRPRSASSGARRSEGARAAARRRADRGRRSGREEPRLAPGYGPSLSSTRAARAERDRASHPPGGRRACRRPRADARSWRRRARPRSRSSTSSTREQRLVGLLPRGPLALPPGGAHWYVVREIGYPDQDTFLDTFARSPLGSTRRWPRPASPRSARCSAASPRER